MMNAKRSSHSHGCLKSCRPAAALALTLFGMTLLPFDLLAANGSKSEKEVRFMAATLDPLMGDWQGTGSVTAAQVVPLGGGEYKALLLTAFDAENSVIGTLRGVATNGSVSFASDGWTATIGNSRFRGAKENRKFELHHVTRSSPTLGAKPPANAIVLFNGSNLDGWAKKNGKEWLAEDGPAKWKLADGGVVEVVPGADCIITHQKFGDCHLHVEFRNLGAPCNSGVFFQDRYELNINETYGETTGTPNAGFDNCTDHAEPHIRPSFPPLAWQTFDVDFRAPRFDANGQKIEKARATVLFNGVKIYDQQPLDVPHGAARRLGEAPKGPLMLQEHGMPLQFRNIWLTEN
jgi:hypothetical protein